MGRRPPSHRAPGTGHKTIIRWLTVQYAIGKYPSEYDGLAPPFLEAVYYRNRDEKPLLNLTRTESSPRV